MRRLPIFDLYVLFVIALTGGKVVRGTELIAVNYSFHVQQLYEQLRNIDPPSKTDPVVANPQIWRRICFDISTSGLFHIFRLVVAGTNFQRYENPYNRLQFDMSGFYRFEEFVFECPLKDIVNQVVIPFYISKEYDVGPFHDRYKPGRFVFKNFTPGTIHPYNYLSLAEEPAEAYVKPGFNIELHYLRMRKYVRTARTFDIDPLCKLVSGNLNSWNNQHYRLCVAVSRSSEFRNTIAYPRPSPHACRERKVSFRTSEGVVKAAGKSYYERMTLCDSANVGDGEERRSFLFISRAYLSGQLLVYRWDRTDAKIYLENLSTNVSILDELNSFEFVED